MRVGEIGGGGVEGVALREVGGVLERDAVAFAVDVAAPVLVVAPVAAPAAVHVAVVVLVPGVVRLELAVAEAGAGELGAAIGGGTRLLPPAERFAEGEAVLRAVVRIGGGAEVGRVRRGLLPEGVVVLREEVAAPARTVAGHDAQAVVRVDGLVPDGQPEDGHAPVVEPDVLREDGLVLDVGEIAAQAPVQVVERVRAGGRERIVAERVDAVGGAGDALREEAEGRRHRRDVAGREQFAGAAVRAHVVAGDAQIPGGARGLLPGLRLLGVEVFQKLRGCGERGERGGTRGETFLHGHSCSVRCGISGCGMSGWGAAYTAGRAAPDEYSTRPVSASRME